MSAHVFQDSDSMNNGQCIDLLFIAIFSHCNSYCSVTTIKDFNLFYWIENHMEYDLCFEYSVSNLLSFVYLSRGWLLICPVIILFPI